MRTVNAAERSHSLTARLERNIRLCWRLASMLKDYFTTGAAIRRSYREKRRRGEIYYVD